MARKKSPSKCFMCFALRGFRWFGRRGCLACLMAGLALCGCRAHPISLAITLVGDVVDDQDLKEREPLLIGKDPSAADAMFGRRHDTLVEVSTRWQWLIYPELHERVAESFYVVEVGAEGRITGLFKCKRNIDGLEDVEKTRVLGGHVYGKSAAEAQAAGGLADPIELQIHGPGVDGAKRRRAWLCAPR